MVVYVAKHHVGLHSHTARPGEVIEEALDEATVRRLLALGAIEKIEVPGEMTESKTSDDMASGQDNPEPENESDQFDGPDGAGTEYVTAEVPEIDVMDGISPVAEMDSPKKPARKSGRSGGKAK